LPILHGARGAVLGLRASRDGSPGRSRGPGRDGGPGRSGAPGRDGVLEEVEVPAEVGLLAEMGSQQTWGSRQKWRSWPEMGSQQNWESWQRWGSWQKWRSWQRWGPGRDGGPGRSGGPGRGGVPAEVGVLAKVGVPAEMGSQQKWGSLREARGSGESRTPAVTSTSLHCFPTGIFPYDLIFPWLSLVILWQGNYFAVKGKQIQAILFPPIFIRGLERRFCFLLQAQQKDCTRTRWGASGCWVCDAFIVPVKTREGNSKRERFKQFPHANQLWTQKLFSYHQHFVRLY